MGKNLEPQYAFRCDKETIEKLEYIAKQNTRTRNQEMKHVIKMYIKQYEEAHGEIVISPEKKENMGLKVLKEVSGVGTGERLADIYIDRRNSRKKEK